MGVGRREFLGWKAVCWEGQAGVGPSLREGVGELGGWGAGGGRWGAPAHSSEVEDSDSPQGAPQQGMTVLQHTDKLMQFKYISL